MMILFSSKTALGRAVSPLTAVLPCGSTRPRVEHWEHSSLHDSRRKSALTKNPGGVTDNSPTKAERPRRTHLLSTAFVRFNSPPPQRACVLNCGGRDAAFRSPPRSPAQTSGCRKFPSHPLSSVLDWALRPLQFRKPILGNFNQFTPILAFLAPSPPVYFYEPISKHQRQSAVECPLSAFPSSLFKIREIRGFQPKIQPFFKKTCFIV